MFRWFKKKKITNAQYAKNRVNLQIHYDRAGLNPEILENIKRDVFLAISKYIDYDKDDINVDFKQIDANMSVINASIPITRIKRHESKKNRS